MSSPLPRDFALPLQGRPERRHLYRWVREEEVYVHTKFNDERNGHDTNLATRDLSRFWVPQVVQYYDRATLYLDGSKHALQGGDTAEARFLELKAQQAMCKAMMTAKGMVESSIRVFGPLPMPGVSSGEIAKWITEL